MQTRSALGRRSLAAPLLLLCLAGPATELAAQEKKEARGPGPAAPSAPATAPATTVEEPPRETLFSLLLKGRWIMIPLGICSLITVTIAFERTISLRRSRIGTPALADEVFRALPARGQATRAQVAEALASLDASASIVGKVLRAGVEKLHRDEAHAQAALEEAGAREAHLLRRKARPFNVVSALGPLLGLLGTISGMITCFEKATTAEAGSRVTTLTTGIYEALVATATGLFIAILSLLLYHHFLAVIDRVVDKIDEACSCFLDHYYGGQATPRARGGAQHAHEAHGGAAAAGSLQPGGAVSDVEPGA